MIMALDLPFYASISMSKSAQGILIGRRSHLRFLKCRKDARTIPLPNPSRRLKHTACCLDPVQITPTSHSVVANLKAIKILSESVQRLVSSHKQSLTLADLDPQTAKSLVAITGGIVALGKFDALHLGHRELVIQASKVGIPFLLSFAGIAEILGWESRLPIVAKCDRKRVLRSWAPYCSNIVPLEYQIDFSNVRHLSPRQFVERLSKELRVGGVVAGANYRFGYKASGDVKDLVRLCEEYGLYAYIVSSVMDKTWHGSQNGASVACNSSDLGQVSSTRVRRALAVRDMAYVAELLGRKHRLMLVPMNEQYQLAKSTIVAPKSCLLNQPPGDGEFNNCTFLLDDFTVGLCRLVIDSNSIRIELNCENFSAINLVQDGRFIGIEF